MRALGSSLFLPLLLAAVPTLAWSCRSAGATDSPAAPTTTTNAPSADDTATTPKDEVKPEAKPVVVQVRTSEAATPAASNTAGPAMPSRTGAEAPAARADERSATARNAGELPNRDKHGNADVTKYIDVLQREERVSDLKVDVVLAKLALPADAIVGDLGCGPGIFTTAFARQCPEGVVYASDIEPRQLDVVREKIRATNLRNIVPVLASEDDPHFPPGTLDIVFLADTYHHLDDRVAYMRRVGKALKPGGRLVVLDYKAGSIPVGPPPEHKLAAGVMTRELTEAGWKLVESFDTHKWQDFEVWRLLQPWEKR